MNIDTKLLVKFSSAYLKNLLLKKGKPLFVNWALLHKCNISCDYCSLNHNLTTLINLNKTKKIIKTLAKEGTYIINFSGGEPLLHDDIEEIIEYTHKNKIQIALNTNGILLPERKTIINKVKLFKISLDGPEHIHDSIRGKGTYKGLIKATDMIAEKKRELVFCTVISKLNSEHLDFVIKKAKHYNAKVFFQPLNTNWVKKPVKNKTIPNQNTYKKAVNTIIKLKSQKEYRNIILNSYKGLEYLSTWPNKNSIPCKGGHFFCHITPDGKISICSRALNDISYTLSENNFGETFDALKGYTCDHCWCPGLLEINLLLSKLL